jgi:hypothetical protein
MSDRPLYTVHVGLIYVFHSGRVRSRDGDEHLIHAARLPKLYGLPGRVLLMTAHPSSRTWPPGTIHLYPDPAGQYRLPTEAQE